MEGSGVRPLQQAPEGLHAAGVGLAPDVLTNRVLDGFMVGKRMVGQGVIGVDLGAGFDVLHDELAHGLGLGVGDDPSGDLVAVPVLHPGHGGLSNRTGTRQLLPLGVAHVPAFATHVGFVHLNRAGEGRSVSVPGPGFADTMQHEPRRGLPDSDIPSQFHGGNALEAGDFQVDGNGPLAELDVAMRQGRSRADAEVLPAVSAAVRHGLSVRNVMSVNTPTVTTTPLSVPERFLKPFGGRFLIGKHLQQLHNRDAFPVGLARCLRSLCRVPHDENIVHRSIGVVNHSG